MRTFGLWLIWTKADEDRMPKRSRRKHALSSRLDYAPGVRFGVVCHCVPVSVRQVRNDAHLLQLAALVQAAAKTVSAARALLALAGERGTEHDVIDRYAVLYFLVWVVFVIVWRVDVLAYDAVVHVGPVFGERPDLVYV